MPTAVQSELQVVQKELKTVLDAAAKEFRERAGQIIQQAARPLFEAHPNLVSFGWRQDVEYDDAYYTFGVKNDEPSINGVKGWDICAPSKWYPEGENPELVPVRDAVAAFLKGISEDTYEMLFTRGAEVTITRDAISVSTFEVYEGR